MTQHPIYYKTIDVKTVQIIKSKSWPVIGNNFCDKVLPYIFHLASSQYSALSW